MDATVWQIISIVGYSLAGLLFMAAVVLFFKLNVPAIIGDLSGKTAARQIQEIRERNTVTGNKRYKPDAFNLERGALTEVAVGRTGGKSGKVGKTAQALAHASKRLDAKNKSWPEKPENGMLHSAELVNSSLRQVRMGDTSRPSVFEQAATSVRTAGLLNDQGKTAVFSEETEVLAENGAPMATEVLFENGASMDTEVLVEGTEVLIEDPTISETASGENAGSIGTTDLSEAPKARGTETEVHTNGTENLGNETEVLSQGTEILVDGTELLSEGTQVLAGTEILSENEGTTVLYPTAELEENEATPAVKFTIVKDIKVIHTTEVI